MTLKQREVPAAMLGRVSSLDWLISIGLLPISFAVTGPVAAAIGAQTALVVAGAAGALVTVSALLLPGMFAVEHPTAEATRLPESDRPAQPQKRRSKAA
jgi:DHA3 family tetracycline resistance protein-like MFS transporter